MTLFVSLPLVIHSRVANENLVNTPSDLYIGKHYKLVLDIEKHIEQSVLQHILETGGFCFPNFFKQGLNIWFAVDNIDFSEDMPTGQSTFHGRVIG